MTDFSPSRRVPKYRQHRPTGQAVVTLNGKDFYLGKYGTAASKETYARLIAEWLERGQQTTPKPAGDVPSALTVNEVILAYLRHADEYYRDTPKEREKIRLSLRPIRKLYGRTPAAGFGPLALRAVRSEMCQSLARTTTNHRVGIIKRMFRWAVGNELVPPGVYEGLRAVEGLKRGRSDARETAPIRPVPDEVVEETLPLVSRHVRGMIEFQRLTGARPGEVCVLRACDLDTSGAVWVYRPATHKNAYRDQDRAIFIGPRAQEVLKPFMTEDRNAYLFDPRLAMREHHDALREARKSKVPPSQRDRRKSDPRKRPGKRYDVRSYYHAVRRACERAGIDLWHPNQLRHSAGTNLRKEFGVELARIILGHKTAVTTEIYAEADRSQAMAVVARIG